MIDRRYPIALPKDCESRLSRLADGVAAEIERHDFAGLADGDRTLLGLLLREFMFGVPAAAVPAGVGVLRQPLPGACTRCHLDDRVSPLGLVDGRRRLYCDRCDRQFSEPESERAA